MRNLVLFLLLLAGFASANIEAVQFDSPEQEARYRQLIHELRCLVCQNQDIADSNAELAHDLRNKTLELLKAGKSNQEILDYMVQRYGDFVVYRPPFKKTTILLWIGPLVLLFIALAALLIIIRNRRSSQVFAGDSELLQDARRRLKQDE